MLHPATLLAAWAVCVFLLPLAPLSVLPILLALALATALAARRRTLILLRRARWLLLSIAVLFAFATPGLSVPGWPGQLGMTQDGLLAAGEHLSRLLILLTTLAVVHERLQTAGLLTGLYTLMAPLRPAWRERIVVRLMLVIEFIEHGDGRAGWRHWLDEDSGGAACLTLAVRPTDWPDRVVFSLLALLVMAAGVLAW